MKLVWEGDKVENKCITGIDAGCKDAAEYAATIARRKSKGKIRDAIAVKKSKFKSGGWIMGIFEKGDSQEKGWENSLAAIGIYVEYGHAFPGKGRAHGGGKSPPKDVGEQPFMRPALRSLKRGGARFFKDRVK